MLDVLAIGAANTDYFYKVKKLPSLDEEVNAVSVDRGLGGSAANFAVGCQKLGLKAGFLGCVGRDSEGNELMGEFREFGVDTSAVKRTDSRTGCFVAITDQRGNKLMTAFPGSSNLLSEEMVDKKKISGTKLLHITSLSSENAFKALVRAKELALQNNVLVSIDPGYILAERKLYGLRGLIDGIDFFFPNKAELKKITGSKTVEGACDILEPLVGTMVVTLGSMGCLVSKAGERFMVETNQVKAVDSTGAGDSFAAGFIYGVLKGRPVSECAELGNIAASLCIQSVGARKSQLSGEEFLKRAKKTVK